MFICFFKQKTAYEMRISDWISDVCSSDLLDRGKKTFIRRDREFSRGREIARDGALILMRYDAEVLHLGQRPFDFAETGPIPHFSLAYSLIVLRTVSTAAPHAVLPEIGRASCRERVCQYV